jgi:hypothetical protein
MGRRRRERRRRRRRRSEEGEEAPPAEAAAPRSLGCSRSSCRRCSHCRSDIRSGSGRSIHDGSLRSSSTSSSSSSGSSGSSGSICGVRGPRPRDGPWRHARDEPARPSLRVEAQPEPVARLDPLVQGKGLPALERELELALVAAREDAAVPGADGGWRGAAVDPALVLA